MRTQTRSSNGFDRFPRLSPRPTGSSGQRGTAVVVLAGAAFLVAVTLLPLAAAAEQRAELAVAVDRTAYEPGATVRLAARVEIEDHWHVNSNTPSYDYLIPTVLSLELPGASELRVEYPPQKMVQFEFTDEPIAVYDGTFSIFAELELPGVLAAGEVEGRAALRYQACDDKQCEPPITVSQLFQLMIGPGGVATNAAWFDPQAAGADGGSAAGAAPAGAAQAPAGGLLWMLTLAVIGGLILNAMPCVLPVLSLKVFALVKSAGQGRSHLVMGTAATTAGILVSFWALASAAVLAAKAGTLVGWGIQFQQPGFVAFLAVVVVLFALNMWGMFEIILPQRVAQVAGNGSREGLGGHFASGLFATLMATPCSAPFLGTAVGFALLQPTPVIFAIFTAIGLGLALPYLLLAAFPGAARLLPKPGAWMVTFKNLMGFLLAGAAVWLFFILAAQIDSASLAFIQATLLGLALCAWLFKHYTGQPTARRFAAAGMAAAAVWCIVLAIGAPPAATAQVASSELIDWIAFDEPEAQRLAADGNIVFVDFTAAWCLTCKSIEKAVIETEEVAAAFAGHGVVPMKADWTNRDDAITQVMARYGRAAVPFYLLYRPNQEPYAFGELLTKPSLLAALDEASRVAALSR